MATYDAGNLGPWVSKIKGRHEAIARKSAQRLFEFVQIPGPSIASPDNSKGGLLPVDRAFLRNSLRANLGEEMPTGPTDMSEGDLGDWEAPVFLTIDQTTIGDIISAGWTASYALAMENRYGFHKAGVLMWESIVHDVAAEARARLR